VNVIRFSMEQNTSKEMFLEDQKRVFVFWFNQHVVFRAEGQASFGEMANDSMEMM
jgi:hypothetical protein